MLSKWFVISWSIFLYYTYYFAFHSFLFAHTIDRIFYYSMDKKKPEIEAEINNAMHTFLLLLLSMEFKDL